VLRSRERQHSAADIARVLGMSVGHWYRIRKDPLRLGRIDLERVSAIARYVGWSRLQVLIAIGWVHQEELDEAVSGNSAVEHALDRLRRHALAIDLTTPLERAAPDHQRLIARLLLAAELRSTTGNMRTS